MTLLDTFGPIKLVPVDGDVILRAVRAQADYGIHFYDGMIIAAAECGGCHKIWSEDLNAGQEYFGIAVENPFVWLMRGSNPASQELHLKVISYGWADAIWICRCCAGCLLLLPLYWALLPAPFKPVVAFSCPTRVGCPKPFLLAVSFFLAK